MDANRSTTALILSQWPRPAPLDRTKTSLIGLWCFARCRSKRKSCEGHQPRGYMLRPGMVRRPITSIAKGEEWCGEATGLRTSLQTPGNTPRLQAKRNKKGWPGCSMCLISSPDDIFWWHLDVSYVSICQNSEEFIMPCVSSQAETDTASLGQACAPFEWFIYFVWWVQHSCPNQVVSWEFWKVMTVTNFNLVCPWFREILWGK